MVLFLYFSQIVKGQEWTEPQKKRAGEAIWPIPIKLQQEITQRFRTQNILATTRISVHTHLRIQPLLYYD